ncbi:DDE-type integrase/transposase/recombinase [Pectobacterium odoriferum]|nr:IS3 family transposase [Pectobacterium odoriferum]MBA0190106.1 DDE-type integrase/transposase/recombinase [Pectobacterium odoriferum]
MNIQGLQLSSVACHAEVSALATKGYRRCGQVIAHSDRGRQYASHRYRDALKDNDLRCSMSGKGCCYDNAVMESFYHTLKTGLMCGKAFVSREEAVNVIFDYIEVFYHRRRNHSNAGLSNTGGL